MDIGLNHNRNIGIISTISIVISKRQTEVVKDSMLITDCSWHNTCQDRADTYRKINAA